MGSRRGKIDKVTWRGVSKGVSKGKIDKVTVNEKIRFHVWKWKSGEYDRYEGGGGVENQGGVEKEREENEDEEADDENLMIERKNDVIFYENVLASVKA